MRTSFLLRSGVLWGAVSLLGTLPACMPDIDTDPLPESLQYDPTTARVPEPIFLVQDPTTGKINLEATGAVVPDDCSTLDQYQVAQCEFNQYLQSMDGYPTLTPAKAPVSVPVDPTQAAEFVKVIDVTHNEVAENLTFGYDEVGGYLTIDSPTGWNLGSKYVMAIQGYEAGLKGAEGEELVGSPIFHLLRETDSLTCGATKAEDVTEACKYYTVLKASAGDGTGASLLQLEGIRQLYTMYGAFEAIEAAGLPRGETAVAWGFSTHTNPVVELDPTKGLAPVITGESELRAKFKGVLNPDTVTAFSLAKTDGTVFLLDLTALAANDMLNGMPGFDVAIDGDELVLTTKKPLVAGNMYGILISNKVTDAQGKTLTPSPVTVLLRASAPLVDADQKSTVSSITDAQAVELEAGRATLAVLLDNELFAQLTGLTRADLAFVYALTNAAEEGGN